jgi:hypothetical protein
LPSHLLTRERLAPAVVIGIDEGMDDGTDAFIIILYNKNKMFLFHFCIFVYLDASLKFGEEDTPHFFSSRVFFHYFFLMFFFGHCEVPWFF